MIVVEQKYIYIYIVSLQGLLPQMNHEFFADLFPKSATRTT